VAEGADQVDHGGPLEHTGAAPDSEKERIAMKRIRLQFMVVPGELEKYAYVPNAIKVKIVDPEAIFLLGILGESGRELVRAGLTFLFEEKLAKRLIEKGIAEQIREEGD
jgi:hypothetical protein